MSVAATPDSHQHHLESWTINNRWRRRTTPRRRRDRPIDVARAIPPGHARASSQLSWREDVAEHPDLLLRRADAVHAIQAVAEELANWADWETMLTRPTHAQISRATGLSTRTVTRHVTWLKRAGLLGLVAAGTTPELSPGILRPTDVSERNEAAVYVLIASSQLRLVAVPWPASEDLGYEWVDVGDADSSTDGEDVQKPPPLIAVDRNGHPSGSPKGSKNPPRARDFRNRNHDTAHRGQPAWSGTQRPASKAERRLAAVELQRRLPVLQRISTAHVAALAREWHLAGWTVVDVVTALQHRPDGAGRWTNTHDIRHVPGWFRHRLTAWRQDSTDRTSPPGPSPTQLAESARRRRLARERARADRERAAAAAAITDAGAAAWTRKLREELRRRSK